MMEQHLLSQSKPSPLYPTLQSHVKLPGMLVHSASGSHVEAFRHSLISEEREYVFEALVVKTGIAVGILHYVREHSVLYG